MASVRVVQTAFGNGLVAARDFEAGETVLTEQPGFLLVDGAPVTRPRLLSAVSGPGCRPMPRRACCCTEG